MTGGVAVSVAGGDALVAERAGQSVAFGPNGESCLG